MRAPTDTVAMALLYLYLAGAKQKIIPLLDKLGIPALVSWAGIDMIDSNHPLVYGRAGVYGQRCANFVLQNSDYVLTIGTRMAIPQIGYNLTELARSATIDVVDIDRDEATKHKPRIREAVVADAGLFIDLLLAKLESLTVKNRADWINVEASGNLTDREIRGPNMQIVHERKKRHQTTFGYANH